MADGAKVVLFTVSGIIPFLNDVGFTSRDAFRILQDPDSPGAQLSESETWIRPPRGVTVSGTK